MKQLTALVVALAIVLAASSVLAAGGRGDCTKDCPYFDLTREEKFVAFDVNEDGYLSPDEFPGPAWAFAKIDADDDGLISLEEWLACPDK